MHKSRVEVIEFLLRDKLPQWDAQLVKDSPTCISIPFVFHKNDEGRFSLRFFAFVLHNMDDRHFKPGSRPICPS